MDNEYINLHLLADRYVQNAMSEAELAAFEERLVWDEQLRNEVDLADMLRKGMRAVAISDEAQPLTLFSRVFDAVSTPKFALAASILLVASLAVNVSQLQREAGDAGQLARNPIILPPLGTRSAGLETIQVDPNSWTIMLVDVVSGYASYRVTISDRAGASPPVFDQDGLSTTYPDALAVGLPGVDLPAGTYILRLAGLPTAAPQSDPYQDIYAIPFRVTVP